MPKNKTGYFLLYLLSFTVSTGIFHAVANAQEAANTENVALVAPFTSVPTPTVFKEQPINKVEIAEAASSTNTSPSQPQAIVEQKTEQQAPTAIPTPTAVPPTATPTPTEAVTPTPLPTSAPVTDLESMFDKYSGQYGVSKELLKKIARCESGFNPTSNNSGIYLGMFQFNSSTWSANRARMGLDTNPDLRTNAEEAIKTAAYVISVSGAGAWPNCH